MDEIDFSSPFWCGALPTRVIRVLSGASLGQLRGWHRDGIVEASIDPGGRGRPRLYGWVDYCKARAAVKLLEHDVRRAELHDAVKRLDTDVRGWSLLPLTAYASHVVAPNSSGAGYHVCAPKAPEQRRVVEEAPPYLVGDDDCGLARSLAVVGELQFEGSLGRLSQFSELIHINPGIFGGAPVLIGTRLETALLAAMCGGDADGAAQVAEMYRIGTERVEAAVEFEKALAALAA